MQCCWQNEYCEEFAMLQAGGCGTGGVQLFGSCSQSTGLACSPLGSVEIFGSFSSLTAYFPLGTAPGSLELGGQCSWASSYPAQSQGSLETGGSAQDFSAGTTFVACGDLETGGICQELSIGSEAAAMGSVSVSGLCQFAESTYFSTGGALEVFGNEGFMPYVTNLLQVVWGSPGSEVSNTVNISASIEDAAGDVIASNTFCVEIIVSDSLTDSSPSHTATLSAAGTPLGTMLSGSGSATAIMQTSSLGTFSIAINEATPTVNRYLWTRTGPGSQGIISADAPAQEISFS